ncbi:MAG: nucleotidyltransferase family protein [Anaerolineae bacterium]
MLAKIDLQHLIQIIREHMPELLERYDVESLGVFGSFARQEQSPESDLDLLVTFRETPGLLRYIALENYLSDLLGVKVDLVMKDALKPHVGKRILEEVIML